MCVVAMHGKVSYTVITFLCNGVDIKDDCMTWDVIVYLYTAVLLVSISSVSAIMRISAFMKAIIRTRHFAITRLSWPYYNIYNNNYDT